MTTGAPSDQFKSLVTKVYTFGFLALALKFLAVESLTYGGIRLSLRDAQPLLGAFAIVVFFSTIAATLIMLRDLVARRVADSLDAREQTSVPSLSLGDRQRRSTFLERHLGVVLLLSRLAFVIEVVVPILFGFTTSIVMYQDVVGLAKAMTS